MDQENEAEMSIVTKSRFSLFWIPDIYYLASVHKQTLKDLLSCTISLEPLSFHSDIVEE